MVLWEPSEGPEASYFLQEQEQDGEGKWDEKWYRKSSLSYYFLFSLNCILTRLPFIWWQSSFGKVTIQIDRVVMLGAVAGEYTLLPESKSGPSRNLEIEFQWSNKQEDPLVK